jgi:putative membrane protein insertion efficiency factor
MCGEREPITNGHDVESAGESAVESAGGSGSGPSVLGGWLGLPGRLLVLLVRGYQLGISPWLGRHCRFHPSCSQYFILSVQRYGAIRGGLKGMWRICRCHPWNAGGYDPP